MPSRTPTVSGENLTNIGEYLALIDQHAVDIVQISQSAGGITRALQIADLALGHELPVMFLPSPGMAMAHLAAVLPNISYMDVFDGGSDKVFVTDCRIEDGWVMPGDVPGHGSESTKTRWTGLGWT